MLGQEPRAGAGQRAVDRREQAALALARQASAVSSRLRRVAGVDLHHRAGATRRGAARAAAAVPCWVSATIIDEGAGGGDLGPAESAEPVERLDAVELRAGGAAGLAVEARVGSGVSAGLPSRANSSNSAGRASSRSGSRISPGMMRARSAASVGSVAGASAKAPVETSSQARPDRRPARRCRRGNCAARVEQPVLGQGAGGDDAHDGALHRPPAAAPSRLGRVLDLLADRDLEPGADQPRR